MKKLILFLLVATFVLSACGLPPGELSEANEAVAPVFNEATANAMVAEAVQAVEETAKAEQVKTQLTAYAGEIENLKATNAAIQTQLAQIQIQSTPIPPVEVKEEPVPSDNEFETAVSNDWKILRIDLKDDPIVDTWLSKLKKPAPELWPTYPNVPNPLVPEFRVVNGDEVPDGVEYGEGDSPFCEQDQRCDWVVPAWHYRLISGDYTFTSEKFSYACKNIEGQPRKGCLIVLFNVMDESYTWRNQSVDNGFTAMGLYRNGDALEWGAWGLVSHASANMLNFPTMRDPTIGNVLNAGSGSSNAGANCGVQPNACNLVDATIVVHAGDRILAVAQTIVSK